MDASARAAEVREATDDDVVAIGQFLHAAWDEAGPDAPGFAGATDEIIEALAQPAELRRHIGRDGERLFIAVGTDGPDVLGFAATRPMDATRTELTGVIVLRSAAGRHLGTALVAATAAAAARDGFGIMVVRTETTNAVAIAFYRHLGFEERATLSEDVMGAPVEVVELEVALSATGSRRQGVEAGTGSLRP